MRICVFGDSIAAGLQDVEAGGWADRLKVYFLAKCNSFKGEFHSVSNFGSYGETSSDLMLHI